MFSWQHRIYPILVLAYEKRPRTKPVFATETQEKKVVTTVRLEVTFIPPSSVCLLTENDFSVHNQLQHSITHRKKSLKYKVISNASKW